MKKLYFIFSLLLMVMGINTAYAGVVLGGQVTDPSTLKDGSKIIMRANRATNPDAEDPATLTYKFYASLADSLVYAVTGLDPVDPYVTMVLEDAGTTIENQAAFYIKNEKNGKYLAYKFVESTEDEDGSIYTDGTGKQIVEIFMTYTADKSKAFPVIITTAAAGGEMMGYTGEEDPTENAMMFIGQCKENNNSLIALNFVYDSPLVASYNDYATWWQVYQSTFVENYIQDLATLYTKIENINFKGGTDPGCYEAALVTTYDAAKEAARTAYNTVPQDEAACKTAYLALEDAYLALVTAKPAPVTEGYYRITSGYSAFVSNQGAEAIKTIYGDSDNVLKWKDLDNEEAKMVWKFIDRKDGTWLLYNVGTGTYVNAAQPAGLSANVTLRNDSTDCGVRIEYVDQSVFNLFAGTYAMHAGGHSSGAGTNGNIVGWDGGVNTGSVWYINSVEEDQIENFEQIGAQNMLNTQLKALYDEAYAKYSIGSSFVIDTVSANYLVTEADYNADPMVIISNADHNSLNEQQDGAGYIGLVDNDTTTYWHSTWGTEVEGQHYLQFVLNKEVEGVAVYLTLRKNQINQATQLDFYVSEDTTNADGWKKAGTIAGLNASTDNSGNGLRVQTNGVSFDKAYKYIRVYLTSNSGFTHFTGFHLEEATLSPTCQNMQLGEIATNLLTQLNSAETLITAGTATQEAIDALQAAYDAYVAELADPTALKAKLDSITTVANNAVVPSTHESLTATTPGVYSEEGKANLLAAVAEVQKYIDDNDVAGTYTKDAISENMQKLETALAEFKKTLVFITDYENGGVWYKLYASQHYYDITGTAQDTHEESGSIRKGQVYVNTALAEGETVVMHNNAKLNVTGNSDLTALGVEPDNGLWRFVNLADTAYAIQNKATGLYIGQSTADGNAALSMTPVAFKIKEIGYATFILDGYRLNGTKTNPLHVQTNGQLVVYWNNYDLGNGSCFDIEATNEPATEITQSRLNIETIVKGKLYAKCYPIEIEYVFDKTNQYAYPYQIATIDLAAKKMTLKANEDAIAAGQPFFYIGADQGLGVAENPTAADTTQMIAMLTPEAKIAAAPLTDNGLVGNFYNGTQVAKGFGVVIDTDGVQSIGSTTANQSMGWNSAYIDASLVKNDETPGTIEVSLSGNLLTSIEEAIIDAQTGNVNVYSIDGVLIKKNVKVSEATKGLAKGIYIVGNKKVAVQ